MDHWWEGVGEVRMAVACGGSTHEVIWRHGDLVVPEHPDLDGERALAAFGGDRPGCVAVADLWRDALADPVFLGEWARHESADARRQSDFEHRWRRLFTEGVQDVLHGVPPARAARVGEVLAAWPQPLQDRLAVTVVAGLDPSRADPVLAAAADRAVAVRARTAFVASLAREHAHPRPDALVPVRVRRAAAPEVDGRLARRASGVLLGLPWSWLGRVWARGLAVVDGRLVLDATPGTQRWCLTVVAWEGAPEARASLVEVEISR